MDNKSASCRPFNPLWKPKQIKKFDQIYNDEVASANCNNALIRPNSSSVLNNQNVENGASKVSDNSQISLSGEPIFTNESNENSMLLIPRSEENFNSIPVSMLKANPMPVVTKEMMKQNGSIEVINLRPVMEIPERYHSIFPFKYFNALQSKVFEDIMYSDKQTVICAPTGSGKTVLFELCMVRLLLTTGNNLFKFKMIYMAPIKALCSERYQDWQKKFSGYGLKCQELTGDTEIDDFQELSMSHILFTTPEKWDSMTRRWKDHKSLVQSIRLFMIDEVHLVNDDTRGATLEAVVSRMKTVQVSINDESLSPGSPMRFIAVSATIPNVNDIASWLDTGISPAIGIKCGEEYRPVALRKVVLGYPFHDSQTDFKFDMMLSYKLGNIIQTYSENKPTIVFCNTRKSVMQGANILVKDARFSMNYTHKQTLARYANMMHDSKLQECVYQGVGFHHAGLEISDRKNIEGMFAEGNLPVLFCTSTLAMGVNLPAHLVVIKGTMYYMMGGFTEYSEAQVLQMMGRAGRPQFDTSATAVIMTKEKTKMKYQGLVLGNQNIESSLHLHLTEHVMAEVVLGTIGNIDIAKEWLKSTFLYRRMLENPKHYGAPINLDKEALGKKLQAMCLRTLKSLESFELISLKDQVNIIPTGTGKLMARFCIAFETVKTISSATGTESLEELVILLSKAKELEDLKIRTNERKILNTLNHDKNRPTIRFPIDSKIKTTEMKVNCLLQAGLGCLTVTDFSLSQDSIKLFQFGQRIARFMMEYFMQQGKFQIVLNSIILFKCIKTKLWENSKHVSKQLEKIGATLSSALINAGITSFAKMEKTNPRELEMIMNRHPPFGSQVQDAIAALPKYDMIIEQEGRYQERSSNLSLIVKLLNHTKRAEYLTSKKMQPLGCMVVVGDHDNNLVFKHRLMEYQLTNTGTWSRKIIINVSEESENHSLNFYLINLDYVGLDIQSTLTPVYLGYFPKQIKVESPQYMEKPKNSKHNSSSNGGCNHRCIDKFSCGHQCCKSHLPFQSTPSVPAKKKEREKSNEQRSGYKESPMISQLHEEINRRKTVLPNVVPLKKKKLELPLHFSQNYSNKNIKSSLSSSHGMYDYEKDSHANANRSKNPSLLLDQYTFNLKSVNKLPNYTGNGKFKLLDDESFNSISTQRDQSSNPRNRLNHYNFNNNADVNQNQSAVEQDVYEFDEDYLRNDCNEPLPTLTYESGNSCLVPKSRNNYPHNNVRTNIKRYNSVQKLSNSDAHKSLFNSNYLDHEESLIISSGDEEERDNYGPAPSMNSNNDISYKQYTSMSENDDEDLLFISVSTSSRNNSGFQKYQDINCENTTRRLFHLTPTSSYCKPFNVNSSDQNRNASNISCYEKVPSNFSKTSAICIKKSYQEQYSHVNSSVYNRIDANIHCLKYGSRDLKEQRQTNEINDLDKANNDSPFETPTSLGCEKSFLSNNSARVLFNDSLHVHKANANCEIQKNLDTWMNENHTYDGAINESPCSNQDYQGSSALDSYAKYTFVNQSNRYESRQVASSNRWMNQFKNNLCKDPFKSFMNLEANLNTKIVQEKTLPCQINSNYFILNNRADENISAGYENDQVSLDKCLENVQNEDVGKDISLRKTLIHETSSHTTDITEEQKPIISSILNSDLNIYKNESLKPKSIYFPHASDKLKVDNYSDWQRSVFYDGEVEDTGNDCEDEYGFSDQKNTQDFFF